MIMSSFSEVGERQEDVKMRVDEGGAVNTMLNVRSVNLVAKRELSKRVVQCNPLIRNVSGTPKLYHISRKTI